MSSDLDMDMIHTLQDIFERSKALPSMDAIALEMLAVDVLKAFDRAGYTTGPKWYNDFVDELKKQPDTGGHNPQYDTPHVLEAARKAAGIADDD